jgi:hypothetical protein
MRRRLGRTGDRGTIKVLDGGGSDGCGAIFTIKVLVGGSWVHVRFGL